MSQDVKEIIQTTALQVANAIKSENSGFAPELRTQLKNLQQQLIDTQKQIKDEANLHRVEHDSLNSKIDDLSVKVQPMVRTFEENKIVKIKVDGLLKTITFYTSEGGKILVFGVGVWSFIRWIMAHVKI